MAAYRCQVTCRVRQTQPVCNFGYFVMVEKWDGFHCDQILNSSDRCHNSGPLFCCFAGTSQHSHWFGWQACRWQMTCHFDSQQDAVSLRLKSESTKPQQQQQQRSDATLAAYVALRVVNQRQGDDCVRYLPLHKFSSSSSEVTVQEIVQLSLLSQQQSPYVVNDSLIIAVELSQEPLAMEELLPAGELVRSPFAAMFGGDLTRFLSGNAFAELRVAVIDADPEDHANQFPFHTGRLEKVSEVMRDRLAPQLKTLLARPAGFGAAQPLVSLDTSPPVLRLFYKLIYEEEVRVPQQLLPGLLDLAVKYDMPVLMQWVQQQAESHGQQLEVSAGGC